MICCTVVKPQTNAASPRQPGQFEQVIDVVHLIFSPGQKHLPGNLL
jgi:hypothetical protein